MRVQNDVIEPIILLNGCVDCDSALVTKAATKLEVVKGDSVVRGLDPTTAVLANLFIITIESEWKLIGTFGNS
jgi:hypothetical protein